MIYYQTFVTSPKLCYLLTLFWLSTFVVLSNLCHVLNFCCPLFKLSNHHINMCPLYTSHTQLSLSSNLANALCASTLSQLNMRLWPSFHSDMGESRHGWGFPHRTNRIASNQLEHFFLSFSWPFFIIKVSIVALKLT